LLDSELPIPLKSMLNTRGFINWDFNPFRQQKTFSHSQIQPYNLSTLKDQNTQYFIIHGYQEKKEDEVFLESLKELDLRKYFHKNNLFAQSDIHYDQYLRENKYFKGHILRLLGDYEQSQFLLINFFFSLHLHHN